MPYFFATDFFTEAFFAGRTVVPGLEVFFVDALVDAFVAVADEAFEVVRFTLVTVGNGSCFVPSRGARKWPV